MVSIKKPLQRNSDFYPHCLEKGLRSERALNIALSEMYVNSVSTSRVSKIIKSMCSASVSLQMETPALTQCDLGNGDSCINPIWDPWVNAGVSCGYYGDGTSKCHCTEDQIDRYKNKISGPLLDRIDMVLSRPLKTQPNQTKPNQTKTTHFFQPSKSTKLLFIQHHKKS